MGLRLYNDITKLNYHFPDNVILDSDITRNLLSLDLDKTYIIPQYLEFRPDLISEILFNSKEYDWILMFINGMQRSDFKCGVTIKYTSLDYLTNYLVT